MGARSVIRGSGRTEGGNEGIVTPHRHAGVFMIAKGRDCTILTKNLVPGKALYNEERLSVQNEDGTEVEYRVWDPFRSDLAAAVVGGADNIWIKPGAKVLYLGAASGTIVSHEGCVYAIEISEKSGRELVNMAKTRPNVIPVIEDARNPAKYKMLAMILALNASFFLKTRGHFSLIINADIHHLTMQPEEVYSNERKKLLEDELRPSEQVTLEPYAYA
ncbi:probable mediator of RNA polymerase II transcription subunit 36b [Brassica rapa]|uniref:probable mediator of RNA polymerase II transcription subunit 36b n=1 Tax=Brassica campestris TaxID=3711 RepID=UPI00142E276B|nr:probable mediator of RNA polymerase II transcription subunit 36b [Brassica rapa]